MRKEKGFKSRLLAMVLTLTMAASSVMPVLADELPKQEVSVEGLAVNVSSDNTIEINQGMSIHVAKDGNEETYMNEFVAKKQTVFMMKIPGSDADGYTEDKAKETVKNYSLEVKAITNGSESDSNELSCAGDSFSVTQAYDRDGDQTKGYYAVANFPTGPDKGTYNIHLYETNGDNKNEIATNKGVNFFETQNLNMLVVPVKGYWHKKYDGGAPSDECVASVKELKYKGLDGNDTEWSQLTKDLKTYLLDVYPVADINIDEGAEIDASDSSYDMCNEANADGQKKLWEEACKLQTKDKESGKDKYDLILAFVAYRQDKGGGQGYTFGKPTNIITYLDPDMFPTVAHEIAHCYQVGDEYDGGSFNVDVNQMPSGYKGRNFVSGDENYSPEIQNADYWQSPKQYSEAGKKENIDPNGAGTLVSLSLHPYMLSKEKFVSWAQNGNTKYPTISYMGSGYSGNEGYYWTSSVIWEHLFKKLLVKETAEKSEDGGSSEGSDNSEESSAAITNAEIFAQGMAYAGTKNVAVKKSAGDLSLNTVSDNSTEYDDDEYYAAKDETIFGEDDFYYDEDYREGDARMIEVSGWLNKDGTVDMDPMFSYEGDLAYLDIDDVPEKFAYTFAALDEDGRIIFSPVDGEPAVTVFNGNLYNPANNRVEDYTSFKFDAEYPEGTTDLVIIKGNVDAENWEKNETVKNYAWSSADLGYDISNNLYGYLAYADVNNEYVEVEWDLEYVDGNGNEIILLDHEDYKGEEGTFDRSELYTEVYYLPDGDDGEVKFIGSSDNGYMASYVDEDGNDLEWEDGYVYIDTELYGWSRNAYVWVKVTDGINACDIYSDELDITVNNATVALSGIKSVKDTKTGEVSYQTEYTGAAMVPAANVTVVDPETGKTLTLKKDIDYSISYENNVMPGTAKVIIDGIGIYPGRAVKEFTILPKSLVKASPQEMPDVVYSSTVDNTVKKNLILFDDKGNQLVNGEDFTATYDVATKGAETTKAFKSVEELYKAIQPVKLEEEKGYAFHINGKLVDSIDIAVTFSGKKVYSDKCKKKAIFKLYAEGSTNVSIKDAKIVLKADKLQYNGKALKPSVKSVILSTPKTDKNGAIIKDKNGNTVYETLGSKNYKVKYSNNTEIGTGRVTIVGKNGYIGTVTTTFEIVPKEVTSLTVSGLTNQLFTGNTVSVNNLPIVVKASGITLRKDIDYTVEAKPGCDYTNITSSKISKDKKEPTIVIKLKDATSASKPSEMPRVTWSSKAKSKSFEKAFKIVQGNLSSASAVLVNNATSTVSSNIIVDGSGQTCKVVKNSDKKTYSKYAYIISGDKDKIFFDKKATPDISKAFAIKMLGLNLDAKYYDVSITTTKASVGSKDTIGKITLKPKKIKNGYDEMIFAYKGSREIKFIYKQNDLADSE